MPGYLRTHPVTTERIADAQNRAAALPYKQHPDSVGIPAGAREAARGAAAMRATR